ncbi:uncharacterized protein BT62DRAFT_337062 [Guyanagaster necrorhizus]|uniref:Uncharacterized protein n=1 Tax=Guyanagaster necrorhizus TaxID=856835 RepID=A0A9P7VNS4_9AGAR|nr:uncharacterized protein BT62DRAFT_337062 [Guyanagaster necrorhizus MCA 3950]KAG7443234.1 hypothetical protein BT62DRAFT_337062 [Guyanagaster necrorhizus MCA 3950]
MLVGSGRIFSCSCSRFHLLLFAVCICYLCSLFGGPWVTRSYPLRGRHRSLSGIIIFIEIMARIRIFSKMFTTSCDSC